MHVRASGKWKHFRQVGWESIGRGRWELQIKRAVHKGRKWHNRKDYHRKRGLWILQPCDPSIPIRYYAESTHPFQKSWAENQYYDYPTCFFLQFFQKFPSKLSHYPNKTRKRRKRWFLFFFLLEKGIAWCMGLGGWEDCEAVDERMMRIGQMGFFALAFFIFIILNLFCLNIVTLTIDHLFTS